MKIGIIGLGVVGTALQNGFEKLGHVIYIHDIKLGTVMSDLVSSEIIYITVPTPSDEVGNCDTSIVENVIQSLLNEFNYKGVIAIKSTIAPGTTQKLLELHNTQNICFIPEFLRERYAVSDFIENHDLCIIGTDYESVYRVVKESHGNLPDKFKQTSPTNAELCKYFNNAYNATLITFANSFKKICDYYGAPYSDIKNIMTTRNHIRDIYLESNEYFKGFAGVCLPKDVQQLVNIGKKINVNFFEMILAENNKHDKIVQKGMRLA